MTDSQILLLRRIDALERTVVDLDAELRRSRARASRMRSAAGALALALTLAGAAGSVRADNDGPLVVGPGGIVVTNPEGKPALTMQYVPGGGRIAVFNDTGAPVAQLTASGNCCGRLFIYDQDGVDKPKVSIGVSGTRGSIRFQNDEDELSQISSLGFGIRGPAGEPVVAVLREGPAGGVVRIRSDAGASAIVLNNEDGNGLLRAYGPSGVATVLGSSNGTGMLRLNSTNEQQAMLAQGDGRLSFTSTSGASILTLGGNTSGGYVVARSNGGSEAASFAVDADGYGRLQLWRAGTLSLIAGTTDGKGDLCVNGLKGSLCMGLLGVKTMTTY